MLEEEEEEEESDEPGLEYLQRELGSVCLLKDMRGGSTADSSQAPSSSSSLYTGEFWGFGGLWPHPGGTGTTGRRRRWSQRGGGGGGRRTQLLQTPSTRSWPTAPSFIRQWLTHTMPRFCHHFFFVLFLISLTSDFTLLTLNTGPPFTPSPAHL